MTHVILGSCIKDESCVAVCPVDCIHPQPSDPDFDTAEQLYIDPDACIDCGSCVTACPIGAIVADFEVPPRYAYSASLNADFFAERGQAQ